MRQAMLALRREGADRAKRPSAPFRFSWLAHPTPWHGLEVLVTVSETACGALTSAHALLGRTQQGTIPYVRMHSAGCGDPPPAEWDNPRMIVTLDSKRRLTVPTTLAPASPGECFDARFDAEEDAIVFRRLAGKEDWLAVLKECPVNIDDVPRRRREPARKQKPDSNV